MWDLDLALSLNPRFMEADRLREELTETATQESDNSVVHDLVRQMIEKELEECEQTPPDEETSEQSHEDE